MRCVSWCRVSLARNNLAPYVTLYFLWVIYQEVEIFFNIGRFDWNWRVFIHSLWLCVGLWVLVEGLLMLKDCEEVIQNERKETVD